MSLAAAVRPDLAQAYFECGDLLLTQLKRDEGERYLREFIDRAPDSPQVAEAKRLLEDG